MYTYTDCSRVQINIKQIRAKTIKLKLNNAKIHAKLPLHHPIKYSENMAMPRCLSRCQNKNYSFCVSLRESFALRWKAQLIYSVKWFAPKSFKQLNCLTSPGTGGILKRLPPMNYVWNASQRGTQTVEWLCWSEFISKRIKNSINAIKVLFFRWQSGGPLVTMRIIVDD